MANSTGSRAPVTGANMAGNAWHYATPTATTTTSSATNGGNGTAGNFVKAGMLAKFGKQAMDNYLAAKAAEEALGGAIANAGTGGAVTNGLANTGTDAAQLGGQVGLAGNEAMRDMIASGLWTPPGEASAVIGGLSAAPLDGGISLASQGGQAVGDLASGIYGDLAGQTAEKAAETAGTGLLSNAAGYVPVVGTALNIGSNLAQGNYGAAGGAATGAALGSIIPGVGTALGGTIGGLLGSFIR